MAMPDPALLNFHQFLGSNQLTPDQLNNMEEIMKHLTNGAQGLFPMQAFKMAMPDPALLNFHQFLGSNQLTPDQLNNMEEIMKHLTNGAQGLFPMQAMPAMAEASSSSRSDSPRNETPEEEDQSMDLGTFVQNTVNQSNGRNYRNEQWHECFSTANMGEYEALIYSVYVIQRDDKKLDGYEYFECINRLQSKCRYKVRVKRMNEFYIIEEKGCHNHAMEPCGTPGSHAGLPKTLREIVDLSFREDWTSALRQSKLEEEVKRLGLPHNPRLSRQVDNRVAYLRRVKNLNDVKKLQEQNPSELAPLNSSLPPMNDLGMNIPNSEELIKAMMQMNDGQPIQDPAALLQMMMNSNGIETTLPQAMQTNECASESTRSSSSPDEGSRLHIDEGEK